MAESAVPAVRVRRGNITETVHRAAAAVVDVGGNLVAGLGDPEAVWYVRSSAKPLQAVAAAEAGAFERYDYSDAQIALATGSHSGEAAHIAEIKSTTAKLGISENDLICPVSYPLYERRRDEMIRAGRPPTRLHHNCSGKHCAMIAAAKARAEDPATYWKPDHPHQQRIVRLMAEMGDLAPDRIGVGVDGCGAPAPAMPLRNVALAFARLIAPDGLPPRRADACRAVTEAMIRYPYLVAGSERFDTILLATGGGSLICKGGAEGYFAAAVRPAGNSSSAVGLALKIEDGNHRASCQAGLEILCRLGLLADEHRWRLATWREIPIKSPQGETVGLSRAEFDWTHGG